MSNIVSDIERIIGHRRHRSVHIGRAVNAEQTVYVMHSQQCIDSGIDLRDCIFSLALDRGIGSWGSMADQPVLLGIWRGRLIPIRVLSS